MSGARGKSEKSTPIIILIFLHENLPVEGGCRSKDRHNNGGGRPWKPASISLGRKAEEENRGNAVGKVRTYGREEIREMAISYPRNLNRRNG